MEMRIIPAYSRKETVRELFTEYTEMLVREDPEFGKYLQKQNFDGGTVILPQDCVYTAENYGPPAKLSGLLVDSRAFIASIEKVRRLQKKYNAQVFFAHDWEFFLTLKKAPEYYE